MDPTQMFSTILQNSTTNQNFIVFLDSVERIVYNNLNMYLLDLPDEDYYMAFQCGTTPEQMAKLIVQSNLNFF